jgi:hypothetical protein
MSHVDPFRRPDFDHLGITSLFVRLPDSQIGWGGTQGFTMHNIIERSLPL